MPKDDSKDDQQDSRPQAQQDEDQYGDPESMDRAQLVAKLDDLGIVYDASANEDRLRATLRRAPELVAEGKAREEAESVGTAQPPAQPDTTDK
jgi:hypothetical protein